MNKFYPPIEPYNHFLLAVDDIHQIYVEECGNPEGQPIIFCHGGPGAGCSINDRRFFDADKYRIILFDQRGCGRSLPFASLISNSTDKLIEDMELIRKTLHIDTWHLFGGSWGSTLALVYAQSYPQRTRSMVLRGIFLARDQDTAWTFEGGGASRLYPDYWSEFLQAMPAGVEPSVQIAYQILTSNDREQALTLARAWTKWEMSCCTLIPNRDFLAATTADETCWTVARHEAHYMINHCFLTDNQILKNCDKIRHINTIVVHGRYDVVCPFDNAWLLVNQLENAELVISESAGHTSAEPETRHHLIEATNAMLKREPQHRS